jgi:uncharacterized protein YcgI (DUF1989 family)
MTPTDPITIPARRGKAARIGKGQTITVINTHGSQVVDTWAFAAADIAEFMSMEHSRAAFRHVTPRVGDAFVTNRRRPILSVLGDTTPGVHDTLIAACDRYRYAFLGVEVITTIAPTTCSPGCRRSALCRRKCRARSICS